MSCMHGEDFMSDSLIREWCRKFQGGWTKIHDDAQRWHSATGEDQPVSCSGGLGEVEGGSPPELFENFL